MIIQTNAQGVPAIRITRSLVDRLLELLGDRASLMGEDSDAGSLSPSLIKEAPSHVALREYSDRTRPTPRVERGCWRVLYGDVLPGPDAVHFDYQSGNVLVRHWHGIHSDPPGSGKSESMNTFGSSCTSCPNVFLSHHGLI